jgi:hypothetical protein
MTLFKVMNHAAKEVHGLSRVESVAETEVTQTVLD